jgi:hypothetical protein
LGGVLSKRSAIRRVGSSKSKFRTLAAIECPLKWSSIMANSDDLRTAEQTRKLQIARAEAIESYAGVEQSLSNLFGSLLGTTIHKAAAVFFKLTSAHNRNKIIESLLQLEHGSEYDIYWHGEGQPGKKGGLFNIIYNLDQTRNEIIHWYVMRNPAITEFEKLVQPNLTAYRPDSKALSISELDAFTQKATFVNLSISAFLFNTTKGVQVPDSARAPWLPIFQQPVIYPPPSTHPLFQRDKTPENQHQAS